MAETFNTIKPGEWTLLEAAGGNDTLPTDLSVKPSGVFEFSVEKDGPNGITWFADFNADGGSATIHFYGGLANSTKTIPLGSFSVTEFAVAGMTGESASLWRSTMQSLDCINIAWVKAYVQGITTATAVTIYGAPY